MALENNLKDKERESGKVINMHTYPGKDIVAKVIGMTEPLLKKEEATQKYGKLGKVFQMMTYPATILNRLKDSDNNNRA